VWRRLVRSIITTTEPQPSEQPSKIPLGVSVLLRSLGLRPSKALGQHFLVARGVLDQIVRAADIVPEDLVVEVGSGLGALTRVLADQGARVIGIEKDPDLANALSSSYQSHGKVRIIQEDARIVDPDDIIPQGASYKLVGNLPYYAANVIVRRFIESTNPPVSLVIMVQKEVAQNMVATPGKMRLLSVGVQFFCFPRIVGYVRPGSFYPPPKITSAIVHMDVRKEALLPVKDRLGFFTLVRTGFRAPRKQIRRAMSDAFGVAPGLIGDLLSNGGVKYERRAETISVGEWVDLYHIFHDAGLV